MRSGPQVLTLLSLLASLALAAPTPQWGGGGDRGGGNRGGGSAAATTAATAATAGGAGSSQAASAQPAAAAATSAGNAGTRTDNTSSSSSSGSGSSDSSDSDTGSTGSSDNSSDSSSSDSSNSDSDSGSSNDSASSSSGSGSGSGHDITVINNCPSGQVRWKYGDGSTDVQTISGTVHIAGDVTAARMWLDDFDGISCGEADGTGCALIEFSLQDGFSSINYSLLGDGLGDHEIHAPMYFELQGDGCDAKAPGICYGMTAAECTSGYVGTDTFSGQPPTCPAGSTNVDATMTFCPDG